MNQDTKPVPHFVGDDDSCQVQHIMYKDDHNFEFRAWVS